MAVWEGFTGAAYKLETPNADCSEVINWHLEQIEQGPRAGKFRYRQIPGLKNFKMVGPGPIRALWAGDNRLFVVSGPTLFEVFQDATPNNNLGNVGNGTNPAVIASNGNQLAIASAGLGYITGGGPVVPLVDTTGQPVQAATMAFLDQYFIAGIQNSKEVMISDLAPDGQTWDPGDAAIKEAYSDNIVRVWVDQPGGELLWLFGNDTIEVWQNTGGLFPFQRVSGAVFSIGCDSAWSVAGVQGVRFWLHKGKVYMAGGLSPQRVSDYGVEQAIKGYSFYDQTNCEGFCYFSGGHTFYVLSFPTAGDTWVYDLAAKAWHKRLLWTNNQWNRYRPRLATNVWGMDIVGDYSTGQLYILDPLTYTDAGGIPLRRDRIAFYITDQMKNDRYNRLTLDMDTGIGLEVAPNQLGYDPQVSMRYSPDRGKTWSDWRQNSLGKAGETERRPFFTQMGSSRIGMAVHVSVTDPVDAPINTAYVDIGRGTMAGRP